MSKLFNHRHMLLKIVGKENREVMEFIWSHRVEIYTILDHALNEAPTATVSIQLVEGEHVDN